MISELIDSKTKDKFEVIMNSDGFKINKIDFSGYSINLNTGVLIFYDEYMKEIFKMDDEGFNNVKILDNEIKRRSTVIDIG